jgi:hypothetical protein
MYLWPVNMYFTAIAFDATAARVIHMHHFVWAERGSNWRLVRRDVAERGHRHGSIEIAFVDRALDQPRRYRFDRRAKRLISGDAAGMELNSAAGFRRRM